MRWVWVPEPADAADNSSGLSGEGLLGGYAEPSGTGKPRMLPPAVSWGILNERVVGASRPGEGPWGEFGREKAGVRWVPWWWRETWGRHSWYYALD